MEAIKNLLSPGKAQDDETLYGSGQPTQDRSGLSGEGSHFGNTRDTTTGAVGQQTSGISNTQESSTGPQVGNETRTGAGREGLAQHDNVTHNFNNNSGLAGNSQTSGVSNIHGATTAHAGSGTSAGASGLGLTQESGIGNTHSSINTTGQYSSNLANRADPRIDSDNPRTIGFAGSNTETHDSVPTDSNTRAYTGMAQGSPAAGSGLAGTSSGYSGTSAQGSSYYTGPSGTAVPGSHHTDTGKLSDPNLNTRQVGTGDVDHHSAKHRGVAEEADHHKLGSGTALGAAGAGLAAQQQNRYQAGTEAGLGNTSNFGHPTTSSDLRNTSTTDHATPAGTRDSSSMPGAFPGPAHDTAGPHKSDLLNKLDPRVDAKPDTSSETTSGSSGSHCNTTGVTKSLPLRGNEQHLGRDTAVAGAGVGAGYEAEKHHNNQRIGEPSHSAVTGNPERASNTAAGLYSSNTETRANPTADSGHHYGRDSAVAGAAAYGASKHHSTATSANPANTSATIADPHSSNPAYQADPNVESYRPNNQQYARDAAGAGGSGAYAAENYPPKHGVTTQTTTNTATSGPHSSNTTNLADSRVESGHSKDHHYGRDATLVGGATYAANKHHDRKESTKAQRAEDKEREKEQKQVEKDHKHGDKEAKKEHKGGLLSFLRRDKTKKYSREEEDEFDRQEREHNSNNGRDAALGGAAIGGTSAYAAQEHHPGSSGIGADTNKPLPTAPGNHGINTGDGTRNTLAGDNSTTGHHHEGAIPLVEKPIGTDLGDRLHGVERNRGVQGSTGFPHHDGSSTTTCTHESASHSHLGRDAVVGGGVTGLAAHEYNKHDTTTGYQSGLTGPSHQSSGLSGSGSHSNSQYDNPTSHSGLTGSHSQHHTGRDAAVLGGAGAGAGALGAHEYGKDNTMTGQQSGLTGSVPHSSSTGQYDSNSGLAGSHSQSQHHTGRDAAILGGAGAGAGAGSGGLGGSEYRNDHSTTGQQSGFSRTGQQYESTNPSSNITGSQTSGFPPRIGHETGLLGGSSSIGENDYRKPDTVTGQTSGLTGGSGQYSDPSASNYPGSSGLTGGNTTGPHVGVGRNKLHKDPPSEYVPAQAQSGGDGRVSASGVDREQMIGQGEMNPNMDTRAGNNPAEGGINPASNY